ncbi:MAG: hypothetical protein LBU35_02500 [Holosporales bacterium]|jgi:hypothetical protein|nr:hypothetical protein [Holosporales bacterium]
MFKKIIAIAMSFCLVVVAQSYFGQTLASSEQTKNISSRAREIILKAYPDLIKIVKEGMKDSELEQFAKDYVDLDVISKTMCGINNEELKTLLLKYFVFRFKSKALKSVNDYELVNKMRIIDNTKFVIAKCLLQSKKDSNDRTPMIVRMLKKGGKIEKFCELTILSIPLVDGARVIAEKFFAANGIKIKEKKGKEKVALYCKALKDFLDKKHEK